MQGEEEPAQLGRGHAAGEDEGLKNLQVTGLQEHRRLADWAVGA